MLPGRGRAPGQGTAAGLQGKTDETGKWAAWHRQASPVVSLAGGEPSAGRGVLGASNPEMPPPPPSPWSRRPRTRAVTTGGPTSLSHPPTQPQDQGCKALAPHDRGRWGAGLWRPRATHEPAASAGTLHTSSPPPSAARSRRARERTRRAERGPGRGGAQDASMQGRAGWPPGLEPQPLCPQRQHVHPASSLSEPRFFHLYNGARTASCSEGQREDDPGPREAGRFHGTAAEVNG